MSGTAAADDTFEEDASPEFRLDPFTREWVAIAGGRQNRPNLPARGCPFCVGGTEAPEDYVVKAFPNRWPALVPGPAVDFDADAPVLGAQVPARGAAEVVLYSPMHDASLASLPIEQVRAVVDLWAERTSELLARPEVRYVLVFENRGAEVGATIAHPHGQIYAFGFVPSLPAREAAVADRFGCPVCAELALDVTSRLIADNESMVAVTRFASSWPFEMLLAPRDHVLDLSGLDDRQRDDLAELLRTVLGRYETLFDEPLPYMLWVHQGVHLHLHVVTTRRKARTARFVAAGELGSGVMFNPVSPEQAAQDLRRASLAQGPSTP